MTTDIIIYGGYLITMEGKGTGIIPNGALAIKGKPPADGCHATGGALPPV